MIGFSQQTTKFPQNPQKDENLRVIRPMGKNKDVILWARRMSWAIWVTDGSRSYYCRIWISLPDNWSFICCPSEARPKLKTIFVSKYLSGIVNHHVSWRVTSWLARIPASTDMDRVPRASGINLSVLFLPRLTWLLHLDRPSFRCTYHK